MIQKRIGMLLTLVGLFVVTYVITDTANHPRIVVAGWGVTLVGFCLLADSYNRGKWW